MGTKEQRSAQGRAEHAGEEHASDRSAPLSMAVGERMQCIF